MVMVVDIETQMGFQVVSAFTDGPRPSDQPADIGPEHGAGRVQGKKWIKSAFFQLTLARNATPAAFHCSMDGMG